MHPISKYIGFTSSYSSSQLAVLYLMCFGAAGPSGCQSTQHSTCHPPELPEPLLWGCPDPHVGSGTRWASCSALLPRPPVCQGFCKASLLLRQSTAPSDFASFANLFLMLLCSAFGSFITLLMRTDPKVEPWGILWARLLVQPLCPEGYWEKG